jgi:hypothetical protein
LYQIIRPALPCALEVSVARAEKSIVVHIPVGTAYRWWTTYEEYPEFLDGVVRVTQGDGDSQRWEVEMAGRRQEWETRFEAPADNHVAWQVVRGAHAGGEVDLRPVEHADTLVTLRLDYEPDGEHDVEGAHGMVDRLVVNSLERFKAYAEPRESRRAHSDDEPAPLGAETVPGPEGELGGPLEPDAGELPFSEHGRRHGGPMLVREDGEELLDDVDDAEAAPRLDVGPADDDPDRNQTDNSADWSRT